jgi:integrase
VWLRTLRALYNRARKEEKFEHYPFKDYDWSRLNTETEKRAISKEDVMKIVNYDIPADHPLADAKYIFTFSYLTYGTNFSDIAKMTRKNIIQKGDIYILRYNRSKGGKLYEIPLNKGAVDIIKFYQDLNPKGKYIFPILDENIHNTPEKIKTRIKTALKKFNRELNNIAEGVGIKEHLTSYVARHSFATILKKENIPISVISEMLGHQSELTTKTYLDSFEYDTKIDASNKLLD